MLLHCHRRRPLLRRKSPGIRRRRPSPQSHSSRHHRHHHQQRDRGRCCPRLRSRPNYPGPQWDYRRDTRCFRSRHPRNLRTCHPHRRSGDHDLRHHHRPPSRHRIWSPRHRLPALTLSCLLLLLLQPSRRPLLPGPSRPHWRPSCHRRHHHHRNHRHHRLRRAPQRTSRHSAPSTCMSPSR